MGLTKTAITRPVFILMLMVTALLIGTISYRSNRVEENPEVNFGVVAVSVAYPGADADTISNLVARPIEESISGVNNLREVTSTSREGFASVVATFEIGSDINVAMDDVRSRVDSVVGELPKDALKPQVSKFDNSGQPVMTLAFNSTKLSPRDLRDLMDNKIKTRFAQIPGVGSANVSGGDVREIQVEVSKDKLLSYGIGINDVQSALSNASLDIPGGHMVDNENDLTVRLKGEFENVDDIRNLVFSVRDNEGKPTIVRLRDVATITDTAAEKSDYSRLNGSDTVVLSIQKVREGNAVEIGDASKALVGQIVKEYADQGIGIQVIYEEGKHIKESLSDLIFSLVFGIILVAITVYVFLHNFRGMMIVAIAIPLCLFTTFIALKAAGFTINSLSMMALSLAVGVLVDDAIVVLENIYRHLRMGENPRDAAINGRSEIGLAAIAITMVDVVVFTPIGFMGGIVGQFFKPLALSFVFCVLSSLFVSFTVTPMLAARWYRKGEDVEHVTGRFSLWFERAFGKLQRSYGRTLEWALNHRWFVFILGNSSLVAVILFMIGSSASSPAGAMQTGMTLTMIALVIGVLTFGINYWSKAWQGPIKPRVAWGIPIALGVLMAFAPLPMPLPWFAKLIICTLMAVVVCFIVYGVIAIPMNIIRPATKWKVIPNALAFGLIFPIAAVLGYSYGMYKAPSLTDAEKAAGIAKKPEGVFKFQFMPDSDQGQVSINVQMPPGSSLQKTSNVLAGIEKTVMQNKDVEYVLTNVGSQSGGFSGGGNSGTNYGQLSVTLKEKPSFTDKLGITHTEGATRLKAGDAVAADLTNAIGRVPGAQVTVSASSGGFGAPIQMTFISDNRELLVNTANKLKLALQQGVVKGVINPDISSKPGKPEIRAYPDRARLADSGLTPADVGASLRTLYQGNDNAKLRQRGLEYPIRVMLSLKDRNDPNIMAQLPVKFDNGRPIMLGDVTTLQRGSGIDKIDRRDRQEEVRLSADLLPGYAAGNAQSEINKYIADKQLLPEGVRKKELGQADAQAREGVYMFSALILGFFLVYMLLASLYDNLLYPAIIQLAQPQAMVGALLALVITDMSLNIVGMIGIICLVGLVGKNAILLVDYTNTLRGRGRNRHDSLVEAGPTRLRPIMMTTIALVLGTLPVALALGRGSEFRQSIGVAIIGGISLSTVLTLVVIPCSYTIFDDLSKYFARMMGRGGPAEEIRSEPTEDTRDEPGKLEPVTA